METQKRSGSIFGVQRGMSVQTNQPQEQSSHETAEPLKASDDKKSGEEGSDDSDDDAAQDKSISKGMGAGTRMYLSPEMRAITKDLEKI